jgi:hypothetical protein
MVGRGTDEAQANEAKRFPTEPALGDPLGVSAVGRTRVHATGAPIYVIPAAEQRERNEPTEEGGQPSFDGGDPAKDPKGGQEEEGDNREGQNVSSAGENHESVDGVERVNGEDEPHRGRNNQCREGERCPPKRDGVSLIDARHGAGMILGKARACSYL